YRHWNAFTEVKRSHLVVISAAAAADRNTDLQSVRPAELNSDEADKAQTAENNSAGRTGQSPVCPQPRDLTPGDHDVPPFHLGGQDMYAISPDGQEVAYTSNIESEAGPAFVEATSTTNEIFIVPMAGGNRQSGSDPKKISTSPGSDTTPLYSPDGKYLAWRSQARAGFESDKWRLLVQDRQSGQIRDLTEKFDRSVGSFAWMQLPSDGGPVVWFAAEHSGNSPIWAVNPAAGGIPDTPSGPIRNPIHADDFAVAGTSLFFTSMSIESPNEIWRKDLAGIHDSVPIAAAPNYRVTNMNDALLSQIDMQPLESFTFRGANDEEVQGFMIKPPGFDPAKKYPLKFLIHGGPQGAWGNSWTYRWNAELFAANGYVVVMINFHGSTGYGQKFTDSISGDWGGKPYVDLM